MTSQTAPAAQPTESHSDRTLVSYRVLLVGILHIAALSAIAVVQPLLDLLGRNAEFFVARSSKPIDLWLLVVGLILIIPTVVLVIEFAVRFLGVAAYRAVQTAIVAVLFGAFSLQVLKRILPIGGWLVVVVAAVIAVGFGYAYNRFETLRTFLTWLSPAPLIVAVLFLFVSPVNRLAFPADAAEAVGTIGAADTPVVIVVWDELHSVGLAAPDGSIDQASYPNTARLAEDATWYRRASGVSDATSLAVPPIVDGVFPDPARLPIAADHPRNLFTLLSSSHQVVAREPVTALCPASVCGDTTPRAERRGFWERMRSLVADVRVVYLHVLLPEDLAETLPAIDRVWGDFDANAASTEVTAADAAEAQGLREEFADQRENEYIKEELSADRAASVRSFIQSLPSESDRPPFVFLHAALPHAPYRYAPSGRQYRDSGAAYGLDDGRWTGDDWAVTQAEQRFLMQTQLADALLGDLLAWLDNEGLYDDALIVVTSDHGVGFTLGGFVRTATSDNFGENMSVPMIVKLPGQTEAVVSDADVRTLDIAPTVLDALGVDIDWDIDGRSMLLEPVDRGPKTQMRTDDVVVEGDPGMPAWDAALATKTRRFADADGVIDVYQPGRGSIAGLDVAALPVVEQAIGRAQVNSLSELEFVDRATGLSPIHVTGRIIYAEPASGDVAVAINGVVAVVGPMLEPNPVGGRFSYFVPDEAFNEGANTIELFLVRSQSGSPELVRIALEAPRVYSTSVDADGKEYLEIEGVGIPINDQLMGRVDSADDTGSVYLFRGWAADVSNGRPADEIVIVVDGVSVLVSPPNNPRPDVADALEDDIYADSGFSLEVAVEEIVRAESVRVFAVSRGEAATELPAPDGLLGG